VRYMNGIHNTRYAQDTACENFTQFCLAQDIKDVIQPLLQCKDKILHIGSGKCPQL